MWGLGRPCGLEVLEETTPSREVGPGALPSSGLRWKKGWEQTWARAAGSSAGQLQSPAQEDKLVQLIRRVPSGSRVVTSQAHGWTKSPVSGAQIPPRGPQPSASHHAACSWCGTLLGTSRWDGDCPLALRPASSTCRSQAAALGRRLRDNSGNRCWALGRPFPAQGYKYSRMQMVSALRHLS